MTKRKSLSGDHVRQGDILPRIEAVQCGSLVPRDSKGRIVLALGEATGHAHVILDEGAELYEASPELVQDFSRDGNAVWARLLRVLHVTAKSGVRLLHEEHGAIHLRPGRYLVRRQREYSPQELRPVSD